MAEGIEVRHQRTCRTKRARGCTCEPGYRAVATHNGDRLTKTFQTQKAAISWRRSSVVMLQDRAKNAGIVPTLDAAVQDVLDGMKAGVVRNRSGHPYKPSVCRSYEIAWRLHLSPVIGKSRADEVGRAIVQRLVDDWLKDGVSASSIRNRLMPLRVVYRRLVQRGLIAASPLQALELPANDGRRDRFATPDEAAALIDAIKPLGDKCIWALAAYAGLRIGEIRALTHADIVGDDIIVSRGFDRVEGPILTKTRAGARRVPILARLRPILDAQMEATEGKAYLLGGYPTEESGLRRRAQTAWKHAGLDYITPHELRHTFASLAIAAGVNAKTLSTLMGHSSITVTLDRYGHLMPGSYDDFVSRMDGYLA
jgi:integrase